MSAHVSSRQASTGTPGDSEAPLLFTNYVRSLPRVRITLRPCITIYYFFYSQKFYSFPATVCAQVNPVKATVAYGYASMAALIVIWINFQEDM